MSLIYSSEHHLCWVLPWMLPEFYHLTPDRFFILRIQIRVKFEGNRKQDVALPPKVPSKYYSAFAPLWSGAPHRLSFDANQVGTWETDADTSHRCPVKSSR
jgi:hypothetical protein